MRHTARKKTYKDRAVSIYSRYSSTKLWWMTTD